VSTETHQTADTLAAFTGCRRSSRGEALRPASVARSVVPPQVSTRAPGASVQQVGHASGRLAVMEAAAPSRVFRAWRGVSAGSKAGRAPRVPAMEQ